MASLASIALFFFLLPFLVTSLDSTFIDTNRTECSYMVWGAFNPANGTVLSSTTGTSRVDCAGGIPPPPVTVVVFDGSGLNLDNICLVGGFNVPVTVSASVQNVQNVPLTNFNACPMKLSVIREEAIKIHWRVSYLRCLWPHNISD